MEAVFFVLTRFLSSFFLMPILMVGKGVPCVGVWGSIKTKLGKLLHGILKVQYSS